MVEEDAAGRSSSERKKSAGAGAAERTHAHFSLMLLLLLLNPSAPGAPNGMIEDYYWLKAEDFCVAHWQCEANVCKGMELGTVLGRCASDKDGIFYKPFPITASFDVKDFDTMAVRMYSGCCKVRATRARARARARASGAGKDASARERRARRQSG